jgi:hypothetical protein
LCCPCLQIFKDNLALAAERNAQAAKTNPDLQGQEDDLQAHGITQFSEWHEFERMLLLLLLLTSGITAGVWSPVPV